MIKQQESLLLVTLCDTLTVTKVIQILQVWPQSPPTLKKKETNEESIYADWDRFFIFGHWWNNMNQEYSFGSWIRKRRQALGLTQTALAEQVGYSAAMIRKIENDERRPSLKGAILLAEALEIPPDQRDAFLKVARQERAVDLLGSVDEEEPFPWQTAPQPQTNLPLPATLFVGREEELASLADLLQDPTCRLVTLVGLAGIGKSRLAVQMAHSQLDRFPHGAFFVSLGPLESPELIVAAIANAIGVQFHAAAEPQEQLLRFLQQKQMLLVLDSFEHLMEGASLLPGILQTAPDIQLLVTSRERLNLQGEWVFEVEGLAYPAHIDERSLERVASYSAVQLFTQGALRVNPSFSLNGENREWVARICRLTEGVPLGLELAAAWVRVLSCQEIAEEIERNLDFLKASAQDIPERHRSMQAALDHSWKLLSAREKAVFRRLSVFRGGFRREAAQKVAGAGLEEITSLLDKSLLKRVGEERYDLHELVRQYAAAHLESEAQEHSQTHNRHSTFYAVLLEQWEGQIASPRQMEILGEMDAEMDNVRPAWSWMAARRQIGDIQKSLNGLWRFHTIRTRLREGASLFRQAAAALKTVEETEVTQEAERSLVLAQVLARQGYFYLGLGRREKARELLQESLALLRASTDQARLAETLAVLGFMEYWLGAFQVAAQYAQESLVLNRALDKQFWTVFCLVTLAYNCLAQGAYEQAYSFSKESLAICRNILRDPHGTAVSLISLSAAANRLGQYAEARQWAQESLQITKTINDRWGMALIHRRLGLISLESGESRRAATLLRQSVSQFREIGDRTLMATTLVDLGVATRASGAYSESKQYFLEALHTAVETESWVVVLNALTEIAAIEMEEGVGERALELVIQCRQHPSTDRGARDQAESESQLTLGRWGQQRYPRLERLRAELESQLTPRQIAAAQARAQARTLENLVQEILAAGE
jgi:predicted ATPase/DNA-binding XRE family transcriptional regulator